MIYYGFQNTVNETKIEIFVREEQENLSYNVPGFENLSLAKIDEKVIVETLSSMEGVKLIEGWCML